jgi:hypothetical protein
VGVRGEIEWGEREGKRGEGERGCVRKKGESERARRDWGNERRGERVAVREER